VSTVAPVMNGQGMVGKLMVRAVVAGALGGFVLVGAAVPALAATSAGGTVEVAMPPLEVLGIYAGIPVGLFCLITLLVVAPSLIRSAGRQPGVAWDGQPAWFGARPADEPAIAGSPAPSSADTLASAERVEPGTAREALATDEPDSADGSPDPGSGGAGGRW
jgi:hypothetical protein